MPSTTNGWNLVAATSAAGVLIGSSGAIGDPDVFWHVKVGEYALHGQRFPYPDPWSLSLPKAHWHSTAWLSELALAGLHDVGGWAAVVGLRLVLVLAILALLARVLLRGGSSWHGPVVFTVVALPLTLYVQDRPQTLSLLYLVWLGAELTRFLLSGTPPVPWRFVLITWTWAWFHAYATLAPVLLAVVALALLADRAERPRQLRRPLMTALVALAACAATPTGVWQLVAPLQVSRAARPYISEWRDTSIGIPPTWGFFAVAALLVLTWARSPARVARAELLYTALLVVYGLTAIRNAVPASLLLAPLVVHRLRSAYPATSSIRLDRRLVIGFSALAVMAGASSYATAGSLLPDAPTRIVAQLRAQPQPLRVFDDYNVSGYLIWATDGHVRLVVDGRAERYGHDFLQRYREAANGGEDWRDFVTTSQAQVAVLGKNGPLPDLLVSQLGWRRVLEDHKYVLLAAPAVSLSPPP